MSAQISAFTKIIREMGEAGQQMTDLHAAEGSAGNISAYIRDLPELNADYTHFVKYSLPIEAPNLARGWVVISATGRRLRDLGRAPQISVVALHIKPDGATADLYSAIPGLLPTSELNSHLAIHNQQVAQTGVTFHAIVHAQPPYITFLSHMDRYAQSDEMLNKQLLRWEPESILMFPEGIGMVPFAVPGSPDLMQLTVSSLQKHHLVIWQRHGVVSRSEVGLLKAADLVEYAETAARYEYMNLTVVQPARGLSPEQIRAIAEHYDIKQSIF